MKLVCCCCLVAQLCWLFAAPRTVARQAPLSMEFSRRNTGVGCHSFSGDSFSPRDWTFIFCVGRQRLYRWATREACEVSAVLTALPSLGLLVFGLRWLQRWLSAQPNRREEGRMHHGSANSSECFFEDWTQLSHRVRAWAGRSVCVSAYGERKRPGWGQEGPAVADKAHAPCQEPVVFLSLKQQD